MPQGPGALVTNPNERQMAVNGGVCDSHGRPRCVSETGMITGIYALFFHWLIQVDITLIQGGIESSIISLWTEKVQRARLWYQDNRVSVFHIDDRYIKDHQTRTSTP